MRNSLKEKLPLSSGHLLVVAAIFAAIGGYVLYRSFAAAPLVASLEAEQMSLPAGGSIVSDSTASGGKAVLLTANGNTTGSVSFPSSVTSLTILAKASQCSGSPTIFATVDGSTVLTNTSIASTSWTAYSVTLANTLNSGAHSLAISASNLGTVSHGNSKKNCARQLYLDVTNFYGPTAPPPVPTVTLSASPTSVTAGQAATLTWNSTNASSCSAAGAWSGSEPTSGSVSTGAINQSSTYSLTCTGSGGSAAASTTVTVTSSVPPPSSSIYWGAYVEARETYNHLYGGTWSNAPWCDPGTQCPLPKYTSNVGKAESIEHWGHSWGVSFDSGIANVVESRGDIPAVDWASDSSYCDADAAAGAYDSSVIIPFAKAIASFGHPMFLLFDEEMNGTWYAYSPGSQCHAPDGTTKTNTAADFVNMWHHVHDVFVAQGATNATWVWCPNVDIDNALTPMSSVYPGDAYVDWSGLNGYNWGTYQGNAWLSFNQVFQSSYNTVLQVAPNKPMMIGEVGSEELGGSKANWITDAYTTQIPNNYKQIKAVLWFNWWIYEKGQRWNWDIESSSTSQQAYAQAIASPYYTPGGQFGNLPLGTKVQPLP